MRKEKLEELKSIIEELKPIKEIKRSISNEKKFLQSNAYSFQLNNGIVIPREKLLKGNKDGSASIIMPVLDNNEVLTVIEPRVFTEIGVGVGFPAGYIEKGENQVDGALRELKEETGYVPEKIFEIDSFYQDEGCSSALNHIYLGLNCKKKYEQNLDENEIIKYMTFNYDELFELEELGYIKGCNAKIALAKSKVFLKERKIWKNLMRKKKQII